MGHIAYDWVTIFIILIFAWFAIKFLAGSLQKVLGFSIVCGLLGLMVAGTPGLGLGCVVGALLGARAIFTK